MPGEKRSPDVNWHWLTMGMCAGLLVDILTDSMPFGILAGFAFAVIFAPTPQ